MTMLDDITRCRLAEQASDAAYAQVHRAMPDADPNSEAFRVAVHQCAMRNYSVAQSLIPEARITDERIRQIARETLTGARRLREIEEEEARAQRCAPPVIDVSAGMGLRNAVRLSCPAWLTVGIWASGNGHLLTDWRILLAIAIVLLVMVLHLEVTEQ